MSKDRAVRRRGGRMGTQLRRVSLIRLSEPLSGLFDRGVGRASGVFSITGNVNRLNRPRSGGGKCLGRIMLK